MRGVCDLQIEIGILIFGLGFDTPCHAYGKGGGFDNMKAHSARPGRGKQEIGNKKLEMRNGK